MNKSIAILVALLLTCYAWNAKAQQSHSLFLMHYLPQSNLLNPAVPISCKWYIGLPVISSLHVNYANSGFSYNNVFKPTGEGTYQADVDGAVKRLGYRNLLGAETHIQLAGIGYREGDYSFMFTLTEKTNLPFIYPKEVIQLAWDGNSGFEGEEANLRGTGLFFTHYREYALSVSKHAGKGLYYGLRAKLLFGKLNVATRSTDVGVFTDRNTFNLNFEGDLKVHSSLPLVVETNDGNVTGIAADENADIQALIFNRKNPGFALDAGIIYPYSDKIVLSASVLDVGFIRWRSNLNTFRGNGNFEYTGPPLDSILAGDTYFDNLFESFSDSMNLTHSSEKYTSVLPPRIIAGASYAATPKLSAGAQAELLVYRTKTIPSLTLSANYNFFGYSYLMASYTIQYHTLRNFGLGFAFGRSPVQFYIVSDNAAGFIWPLSARNINLRFGLNINLGCSERIEQNTTGKGALQGNCYWLEKSIQKNYDKQKEKKSKR